MHAQFRYGTAQNPKAKRLEPFPLIFFQTSTDANRYSAFLRLIGAKIWNFVDRKRLAILRRHVRRWQDGTLESLEEGALKNGHFVHETADLDRGDLTSPRELQRQALQVRRLDFPRPFFLSSYSSTPLPFSPRPSTH